VPAFVTAAGPAYAQIVTGTGFAASSTVQFNGSPRATTFVSSTQIVAQLGAADVAGIGSAAITVVNGGSNPTTSGQLTLTIGAPTTDATAMQINPQHTGAISFASVVGPTELPTSPAWTAQLDGFSGYPLIAGGRVFVTDYGNGGELVALSAATGAVVWGPVSVPDISGATYDNGRVITVSGNGVMSGFDATSGNKLWSTQLSIEYTLNSAPTAANGIVFVGGTLTNGALFAVDDSTGTLLWTAPVLHGDGSSPTVTSDGVYVSYPCQTYDFSPATGATVWHVDGGCDGGGGETGSYANGVYYSPDIITSTTGQIFGAETGTLLSDYTGTPALGSSVGYFVRSGTLQAIDLSSNAIQWTFTGDGSLTSLPILVNSYVFVAGSSGKLYALDASTGNQIWSTSLTADVVSGLQSPEMAAGNGLLLVPVNKSLVAYKLSDSP
jgi:outer membrane protein assembly factor BamB